jgi:BirA family biotin operon repressor/biotin-[acetyl-CoA-carboxylase] ligase
MTGASPQRAPVRLGRPLVWLGEVESTNDIARLLAAGGLPEGTAVVAVQQTRGRGRYGRTWVSPPGGLWCSLILRPRTEADWGPLSLAIALAVAEAIDLAAGAHAMIRWPNDVVIGARKAAGILIEAGSEAVIVGIGINVNNDPSALPGDLRTAATSLAAAAGHPVGLAPLLEILLERCDWWCAAWSRRNPAVLAAWSARDAIRGRPVVATGAHGVLEGTAEGVDADGCLRLRLRSGEIHRLVAGDVTLSSGDRRAS